MLLYSMNVSVDGFIADRDGSFAWTVPGLRMLIHPVIVGGGTPFLPPVTEDIPLELMEARALELRVVFERYRTIR
jgi:dihydrofolate reductase